MQEHVQIGSALRNFAFHFCYPFFFFVSPENASANFSLVGTTRLCALDRILRLMAAGFGYEVVAV